MIDIKSRIAFISAVLLHEVEIACTNIEVETCGLQIRKIIESIMLSSLLLNENELIQQYSNINNWWNAKRIFNDIKKINPYFFPKANIVTARPGLHLTHQNFEQLYDECCNLLHANNPLASSMDYTEYREKLHLWTHGIINLLNDHIAILSNDKYLVGLSAKLYFNENKTPEIVLYESEISKSELRRWSN